jgi:hypothetical protein
MSSLMIIGNKSQRGQFLSTAEASINRMPISQQVSEAKIEPFLTP